MVYIEGVEEFEKIKIVEINKRVRGWLDYLISGVFN